MDAELLFGRMDLQKFGKGVLLQMVSFEADMEGEKKLRMRKREKMQVVACMVPMVRKVVL